MRDNNYNNIKSQLKIELMGKAGNEDLLNIIPHTDVEDISIVYRITGTDELITNETMRIWGISADQLHNDAVQSSKYNLPPAISPISSMLGIEEPDDDFSIIVLTTNKGEKGAAVVFYPGLLNTMAKEIGEGFYILPSSIHEVLLYPDSMGARAEELEVMVRDVNASVVDTKDQLTDSVYHYDPQTDQFELGRNYESRVYAKREAM